MGDFSNDEKIIYSLKYALNLTTKDPTAAPGFEFLSAPRIFPSSIPTKDLLKVGEGDIDSEGKNSGGGLVDLTAPYDTVKLYKIIDPLTNKVSNKNINDILGTSYTSIKQVYNGAETTNPTASTFSTGTVYRYWFHDYNTAPYDGSTEPAFNWKGLRLAYAKSTPGDIVLEDNDNYVPHIGLYLGVPLTPISNSSWANGIGDSISYEHEKAKGRYLLGLLGLSNTFKTRILKNDYNTIKVDTASANEGDTWFTNPTYGLLSFYGIKDTLAGKQSGIGVAPSECPRLSFCRYIGESVDFSNLGSGGGGASVTVGEAGEDAPTDSVSKGDLFFDIDDDTLKINKDGTANGWVGVGGGNGTGLAKSQVLESISTSFNGSTITTNKSGSLTFDKITSAVTTNTTSYTEITLIDSYIPPENTKSVLINYSLLLSKGWTTDKLNQQGGLLEWVLLIDDQELSLSKNSIYIHLVDKYATISTIINLGGNTDYDNNIINQWTTGKKISVKCKSGFTDRNIKLHYSNDNSSIILPTLELVASGVVLSSNLNSILTIGNAGEDPPSDGAKGELFFDIDDNKLYINKDSTSNGWVTVSSSNTASINSKNAIIENAVIDDLVSNKLTNLNNKTIYENIFNNSLYTAIRDPTGSADRRFGIDMDISEKYMIIGSTPKQNTKDSKFHIYNINNDGSLSFSTTITDPEVNSSHTSFGRAVAINDKYAVVGDYRPDTGYSGKVYIYKENNGVWSQDKEISSSDNLTNAYFGIDIAINSKYIAVGASRIGGVRGEVFLYELDSDGNWGIDSGSSSVRNNNYKLLPSNPINNNHFGNSIAMSEKYIVVGAYGNQTAYVYEMHSDGKWGIPVSGQTYRYENSQLKGLTITNDNTGEFGRSVATYGEYVVVGAQSKRHTTNTSDNGQGAAFIYEKTNDGWIELHEIKALSGDKENFSNSIYLNDRYIIVGAMGNPYASNHPSLSPPHGGVAYIFEKNLTTGKWGNSVNGETYMTESFKITNTDWGNKEYITNYNYSYKNLEYKFGWKVLINNKGAYISAPVPFTPSRDIYSYKGIVYLYKLKNHMSSNLINCDFINIGTDFSNSKPEYKLKIISSGETMYDYSDKPYYGHGLYLKCEANHYGRAAVFETSQTTASYSYRGYLFSHRGSIDQWNAGKAENGCGIFVIDSQGPSNDSNNFNASYYDDGCSFLVGNNLSNNQTKQYNFIVKQNSLVGIGTNNPEYPLQVNGWNYSGTQYGTTTISKFNSSNEGLYIDHTNDELVTIKASNGVWASAFMATSDKRIKENIINVSDNIALQKLRDISCVHYEYKDKFNKGSATTIGFIAQQVKEHIPMAVSIQQDTIPNEMRVIETPQWTEINDGSDNKFKLTISDLEDVSGNTKYRFYVSNDLSGNDECEKEIHSLEDEPNSFIFDQSWNNVFLYGKEVDDLHTLDKQKLFALNFSATQEIDRIQQRQIGDISLNQIEINEAKQKINLLETENTTLKDRVVNLETQNSTLLTRLEALEKKINDLS
jgi:hypothetical protein